MSKLLQAERAAAMDIEKKKARQAKELEAAKKAEVTPLSMLSLILILILILILVLVLLLVLILILILIPILILILIL